jgi:hypothetical protein
MKNPGSGGFQTAEQQTGVEARVSRADDGGAADTAAATPQTIEEQRRAAP